MYRMVEATSTPEMGIAPGGKMRQEIYDDPFAFEDWDLRHRSRCFLHLANSRVWRHIVGAEPPTKPPTAPLSRIGVSTAAGQTTVTPTPRGTASVRSASDNPTTACLVAT